MKHVSILVPDGDCSITHIEGAQQILLRVNNQSMPGWIVKQYQRGTSFTSRCIGAYLLAGARLSNGKSCATHWAGLSPLQYRNRYNREFV